MGRETVGNGFQSSFYISCDFFLSGGRGKGEKRECCYFYGGFDFKTIKDAAFTVAPCSVYDGIALAYSSLNK